MSHPAQRLGVVAESAPGETRVAATPATLPQLLSLGYEVIVESGAGERSGFTDDAYVRAGARIGGREETWGAGVVLKVNAPAEEEIVALPDGATLVSLIGPAANPGLLDSLARRPVTVLAMDAVPRISRAQSLDVLSSMANIAGYRAVIEAAHAFGRFFTGQVTAAGKIPPAKVLVAGAGVAGLAATATAVSLGAIVRATDPRPEVAEQVRSLGAEFLDVGVAQRSGADGYARETSQDYDLRAAEMYAEQAADVDIVVTTALIPGRPAPTLLTAEHVALMRPGSVIVDMAAAQGGNVAGTRAGEVVVTGNGVTIIGYTDLAGRLPAQSSQLYGTNLVNLMKLLTPDQDGHLRLDFDDPVQRAMTVVRDGEKTWPPPPIAVSAAPAAPAAPAAAPAAPPAPAVTPSPAGPATAPARRRRRRRAVPADRPLAERADRAPHRLRPVDRDRLLRHRERPPRAAHAADVDHQRRLRDHRRRRPAADRTGGGVVTALAFVAILLASINIFGGFAVTRRMLGMFTRS